MITHYHNSYASVPLPERFSLNASISIYAAFTDCFVGAINLLSRVPSESSPFA